MDLSRYPRRHYTEYATPIIKASRLSQYLGGPNIYIKRDDLLGLAAGGNKTRKLEYVVADALRKKADTLITCGGIQSNHCRLTLAAANVEGLACHLVLQESIPGTYNPLASGNNLLYHLLGVKSIVVCPSTANLAIEMDKLAEKLTEQGHTPYIIPMGASNPIGALGYVACAQETAYQLLTSGISIQHVICADGSGGTQAGLVAGFLGRNSRVIVTGINAFGEKQEKEEFVYNLVEETYALMGINIKVPRSKVICFDEYVGPGYTLPTAQMIEAVQLLAHLEGILLDPVYTGKAMAGLIDLVRQGYFKKDDNILFVHTGGTPALYNSASIFLH